MHLSSLKIAGFKSFYQPTNLHFPSNRVVLVGPNGCGKSNIIDAIRWVLGESAAAGLRSDSLDDILFSGTEDYSPVGRTSVELTFDNRQGRLEGKLAKQDYIKVRRVLEKEQGSRYYINSKPCRRKDIEELFTGLGLTGKANYAIITQGTIHNLVESKPEYIRLLVEEAAKITDYHHKRRETLAHIKNTKINLKQVSSGLRDIKMRMTVLAKQAQDAQEFYDHQQELKKLKKELIIVLYQDLEKKKEQANQRLSAMVEALQNYKNEAAKSMVAKEKLALGEKDSMALLQDLNARLQQLNNQLLVLETSQKHSHQRIIEKRQQIKRLQQEIEENQANLLTEQEELSTLTTQLKQRVETSKENLKREPLVNLTDEYNKVDAGWQDFLAQLSEKKALHQQLKTQLSSLEQEAVQLEEAAPNSPPLPKMPPKNDSAALETKIDKLTHSLMTTRETRDRTKAAILNAERKLHNIEQELTRINTLLGELAQPIEEAPNESIDHLWKAELALPSEWEEAIGLVTEQFSQARISHNLAATIQKTAKAQNSVAALVTTVTIKEEKFNDLTSLGAMLEGKYIPAFLYHIYGCPNLARALGLQTQLKSYQSLITPQGEWLGKNWIVINRNKRKSAGTLAQRKRLALMLNEKEKIEKQKGMQLKHIKSLQQEQQACDSRIHTLTTELEEYNLKLSRLQEEIATAKEYENQQREHLIAARLKNQRKSQISQEITKMKGTLKELLKDLERQAEEKTYWQRRKTELHQKIQLLEDKNNQINMVASQAQREQLLSKLAKLEKSLADRQQRHQQLIEQEVKLTSQETQDARNQKAERGNREKLLRELARLKEKISHHDKEMRSCAEERTQLDNRLTELEKNMAVLERDISQSRAENEQLSLDLSDMISRNKDLNRLPKREKLMDARSLRDKISQLERALERSEGINQLALRDYQKCKTEYDEQEAQYTEIQQALKILEKAIGKMDKQSKKKFSTTFKDLNDKFRLLFSQLSGGGLAYLEESESENHKGIRIIASPRGRRKTNITSLSGGEKTVVAIALIMAIFQLSPSPFCLMDEADAMLDDDNVLRFNNMIATMSANTQFILITHNKSTVRNAQQLIGVTMAEPGVSQMVSVDMNKALELSRQVEA